MDYSSFFEILQNADCKFRVTEVDTKKLLGELNIPEFYQVVNPVNVEFEFNDGMVKLEPFESLMALNEQYRYVASDCVFATCNGDPIYIRDGKIYTCIHGSKRIVEEKFAESIKELFEQVCSAL